MAIHARNTVKITSHIVKREAFKIASMSAEIFASWDRVPKGRLAADTARHYAPFPGAVYVVFSYGTPIAWRRMIDGAPWHIPADTYSPTTSNHQSIARCAAL